MKTILTLILLASAAHAQIPNYWKRANGSISPRGSGDSVSVGATVVDPVNGITTPRVVGPAGTPITIAGACQAPASVSTPSASEYALFLNSDNSCHLTSIDSSRATVDLQGGAVSASKYLCVMTSPQAGDTITAAGDYATTCVIPAGTLQTGMIIEVWAAGTNSTGGSTSLFQPVIKVNGSTLLTFTQVTVSASQTARFWQFSARLVVTATGASGTFVASGFGAAQISGTINLIGTNALANPTANTASNITLALSEIGTISSGSSSSMTQLIVTRPSL